MEEFDMKITIITGSPRKHGNSNHLADQFIKGAEEAGHQIFRFDAANQKFSGCIGCLKCQYNGPCVFNDDFEQMLREKVIDADCIVFASPVYWFGFSWQIKKAIDRFNAIYMLINQMGKKAVLLLTQNNTDEHVSDPIKLEFEHIVDFLGWKNSGELVATGVGPVGAVNDTDFSKRAYEMGHNI
jgi:multimeric flavodoxin WrbA